MDIYFLLKKILKNLSKKDESKNSQNIPLKNIVQDHRRLQAGDVFVAIKGNSFDGHSVLPEVAAKKPAAIIVEDASSIPAGFSGQVFEVTSSRKALDILANGLYGSPSQKLFCVGITGTNGKTTTSHLIEHALNHLGLPTGVIGTIDHHLIVQNKKHVWETSLTTPGSLEFYSRLKDFLDLGAKALSVEVSSHALEQDRMSSCQFDGAIFTNLTRDHLDYHGSMENYFLAKQKLFTEVLPQSEKKNKFAIVNTDDEYGKKLLVPTGIQKISYGLKNADLTFKVLEQSFGGQTLSVQFGREKYEGHILLCGHFNALNIMATVGVLLARGEKLEASMKIFEKFPGVRGRLEKVSVSSGQNIFVDYAHTPDALENVLKTLQAVKQNKKIITVFGCGGDRDKGKRPTMGDIACKMSDHVVITSDNPRTEDPQQIIKDIVKGCGSHKNFETEPDRKKAIEKALTLAKNGDAVLIAGKGHEDYQVIGTQKIHFDDAEVVRGIMRGTVQ